MLKNFRIIKNETFINLPLQKIKIEVNFEGEISNLVKCNCSICKRKGAVMGIVGQDSLKIIEGEKYITNYKFHSKVANHFFCSICGIYTHHNPRRDPTLFGFNIGCIDELDNKKFENIKKLDGKNHPLDNDGK